MKPKSIGAFDAKTHLSELLEKVGQGHVYVITKHGRPVAELRPATGSARLRFGCDAGAVTVRDDFDAPVPGFEDYTA